MIVPYQILEITEDVLMTLKTLWYVLVMYVDHHLHHPNQSIDPAQGFIVHLILMMVRI